MSVSEAQETIDLIRGEIEAAAEVMLSAAEQGLRDLREARRSGEPILDGLEQNLRAILEASAFQDLIGQRLSQLSMLIGSEPAGGRKEDPLLNGPAAPGQGLDQAAADALFESPRR